jgi:hypothetical protein
MILRPTMQRVFFHIHLWKTGGTSFFNMCADNFGRGFRRDVMLVQSWFLSVQQIEQLLRYHDWLRCYSCHMLSGDLPYDFAGREVVGIAFVRDPVERFISSYTFQSGDTYRGGTARYDDFDAFIASALVRDNNPWWRNGQTFVLGGSGEARGLDTVNRRLDTGRLLILPTERFDECCVLLERLYPRDFKDCSYARENVSRRRHDATAQQRQTIARYMDVDFKLIERAHAFLDSSLDRVFADARQRQCYLEQFRRRCRRKQRRRHWTRLFRAFRDTLQRV